MENNYKLEKLNASDIKCNGDDSIIGAGGSAVVVTGYHPKYGKVAVKCYYAAGTQARNAEQIIKKETELLQQANHKNIARVYGWVRWGTCVGIVQEFYEGGDLHGLLMSEVNLVPLVRLRIALEIASGLSFIHNLSSDKRMIHGDLKRGNILLNSDLRCFLGDFGNAKLAPVTKSRTIRNPQASKDSNQLTTMYAAPEVLANPGLLPNQRQDVYSFAMVVHSVLTRHNPFQREDYIPVRDAVTKGQRPDTTEIQECKRSLTKDSDREIISKLESVMRRCWNQDPMQRPTMMDVRDELQELFDKFNKTEVIDEVTSLLKTLFTDPGAASSGYGTFTLNQFSMRNESFCDNELPEEVPGTSATTQVATPLNTSRPSLFNRFNFFLFGGSTKERKDTLIRQYVTSAKQGQTNEAKQAANDLAELLKSRTTAEQLRQDGNKLREEKKYLDAILFFQVSSIFFANESDPNKVVEGLRFCAWEMRDTNETMVESDVTTKPIVRDHVIPLMRDIRRKIENKVNADDKKRILNLVRCLHRIEFSESLIEDRESQERDAREGISLMEEKFQQDATKYRVYAYLLNNLGVVCGRTNRIEEAVRYYSRSLEAYKKAEDLTEEERKEEMENTEYNLRIDREKLNK